MLLENFASRPYPVVKVSRNEMNSVMELLKIFTYSSGAQATANVSRMLFIVPATGSQALGPWLTGRAPAIFTARGPKNTLQPLVLSITPYLGSWRPGADVVEGSKKVDFFSTDPLTP
jgi:hypothetical protein